MLRKLSGVLDTMVSYIIGLALLVTTLIMCFNVFTRYLLGFSLVFAEELTTYTIIWATFLGSGLCVQRGIHVSVDAFVQLLPARLRRAHAIMANLVGLAFSGILLKLGLELSSRVAASGQLSPAMMVPVVIAYIAIPLGAFYMCFSYIEKIIGIAFTPHPTDQVEDIDKMINSHV